MKRYGNLYEQIYSMDNLRKAHQNARKGKGWYQEVKEVDADIETYLKRLQEMLITHTYQTSPYEKFIKRDSGKEREIFKLPYFPDRICQWAILQVIEPYLLRHMTKNTYSAIPERGIHAALHDVQKAMRKDVPNCQYCLKLDVRHYYPSINHGILKAKFRRLFKDAELLWLLDEIIDSICTAKIEDMRDIWLLDEDIDTETGIPIGNYLSQYCGNFYLSGFDHWIKEEKRVKHYFRYMDDIVIFGSSKEELHALKRGKAEYSIAKFRSHGALNQAVRHGLSAKIRFAKANMKFIFEICFSRPRYLVRRYPSCRFTTAKTCSTFARIEDFLCSDFLAAYCPLADSFLICDGFRLSLYLIFLPLLFQISASPRLSAPM